MRADALRLLIGIAISTAAGLPPPAKAQGLPRKELRTVRVGPTPGDTVDSGMRLLAALASIEPTSCPGDNWLLWIAPGVYDLGGSSLVMKPCVDVEGAGERATRITAAAPCPAATVIAATDTALRMLTIANTNTQGACAVRADGVSSTLERLTIAASGGFANTGIVADGSALTLDAVTVLASDGQGNFAISAQSSSLTIRRSRLAAAPASLGRYAIAAVGSVTRVAHSELEGDLTWGIACFGNHDADLAPVTCP